MPTRRGLFHGTIFSVEMIKFATYLTKKAKDSGTLKG